MSATHETSRAATRRPPLLITAACALLLALPTVASAAVPSELWQTPEDGLAGAGAGQLDHPRAVAADPTSGHIYVTDSNARVSEFDAWGEFVKAWGWGVANGTSEPQTCGPGATPPSASCLPGISGAGVGQLGGSVGGVAVDAAGNVYVDDRGNHRIQKFDANGQFLLMFGGDVDQGPHHPGDLCTKAFIEEGDNCGAGENGIGPGEFSNLNSGENTSISNGLDFGPSGTLLVGDLGRVEEFNTDGTFKNEFAVEAPGCEGNSACESVTNLAVDASGNVYVMLELSGLTQSAVFKLNAAGEIQREIFTTKPNERGLLQGIATDPSSNLYIAAGFSPSIGIRREVLEFDPAGNPVLGPGSGFAQSETDYGNNVGALISGIAINTVTTDGKVDIYLPATSVETNSYVTAYGPAPDKWPPPHLAPEIQSQYAVTVDPDRAVLGARINPRYWSDTSYYVEWGTGKCAEGGCSKAQPAPPGTGLQAGIVGFPVATKGVTLANLIPGTTYHYRFVAESSGGGPVHGEGSAETEGIFLTPVPASQPSSSCPNQVFRVGASAGLPDCRAYEMVSPIAKNNTDINFLININSNLAALNQSASAGNALTYTTSQAFGDAKSAPYVSQYIARRGASGWENHGISPVQGISEVTPGRRIDIEFRAFTPDLCASVLQRASDPPLVPGAPEKVLTLYRRQNCGEESYQSLLSQPPNQSANNFAPEVQGLSSDGRCTVFYAKDQLTPDANPASPGIGETNQQIYESCDGQLRVVSVLPNGVASTAGSSAGTPLGVVGIRSGTDAQALSSDGSRVYWTESEGGAGKLYLRINADQDQSDVSGGVCIEEEKACTIKVSQTVSGANAHFWGASADGSRAVFTIVEGPLSGNMYEFNLEEGTSALIAGKVTGVLGIGGGATRAYFVSAGLLAGANERGESPTVGRPNLYMHEAGEGSGTFQFIGTLTDSDNRSATSVQVGPTNLEPYKKVSRVSPDGRHAVFMSAARLTGYDNTDSTSREPDAEVFVYNSDTEKLACASCNPTGQQPIGRRITVEGGNNNGTWGAALLSPYITELYGSRVISDDGQRVFFNSYDALLPSDTNGKADVYEWEVAGGGDCNELAPTYSHLNGGCLSLISSGESPTDSEFVDASADGTDVFFTTAASLLPQDPGLIDIYDARVGGGYPPPPPPPAACEGEACQGPLAPPNDPTPASSQFDGAGNVTGTHVKKKARKKHKHAKKIHANKHGRTSHKRRAGK